MSEQLSAGPDTALCGLHCLHPVFSLHAHSHSDTVKSRSVAVLVFCCVQGDEGPAGVMGLPGQPGVGVKGEKGEGGEQGPIGRLQGEP